MSKRSASMPVPSPVLVQKGAAAPVGLAALIPRAAPTELAKTPTPPPAAQHDQSGAQGQATKSAALLPLSFKMPREFDRAFRDAAYNNRLKLNELLEECFEAWKWKRENAS